MGVSVTSSRDILIVGSGVFGTAIAWYLARMGQGHRVLILERGHLAGGATSRAAALVTQMRDDSMLVRMAQETLRVMRMLEEDGEHLGRHVVGSLHVASRKGADTLLKRAQAMTELGVCSRVLTPAQAHKHAPWLNPHAFDCAVYFPDDCYVDPYQLASAYLRGAVRGGAQLMLNADVRHVRHAEGCIYGVELRDGRHLEAQIVINAAGAWANLLSVELGLPLPMAPVRSQYWITESALIFPREGAIVFMPEIRAYARPEVGALLFGIREPAPAVVDARDLPVDLSGFVFDPTDPEGWDNLAEGVESLEAFFPAVNTLGIAHYVTGPSNYTDDGQLILGPSPEIAGLFTASGCNGSGITFSGGVGSVMADRVLKQPPFISLAHFDPARRGAFDPFSPTFLAACGATRAGKSSG